MAAGSSLAPSSRTPEGKPANNESLIAFALPELNEERLEWDALPWGCSARRPCARRCARAQPPPPKITTPEGAVMNSANDLAYKPGQLTQEQLMSSTARPVHQPGRNVFRRYPRDKTEAMVKFYTEALALKSLSPIQLTATQQMLLTGVGHGQIKLSAGQQGNRKYDLDRRHHRRHRHPLSSCFTYPDERR